MLIYCYSDLSHLDDTSSPHVTRAYYEKLFPFKQLFRFYNTDDRPTRLFTNREFAFTVKDDIYLRYLSFSSWEEWKKETLRLNPSRFEIGAVYTARVRLIFNFIYFIINLYHSLA